MARILLCCSAVRVYDSQVYRKMEVTMARISCILEMKEMLLSFQTGFNLVNAAVACAILESTWAQLYLTRAPSLRYIPEQYG